MKNMQSWVRVWAIGILLSGGVASAVLVAQTRTAPEEAQQEEQPTFRMAVNLVRTDVIVRDENGQFISDLTKEDFEVFEDDVRQELASLVLVHGGRVFNLEAPPPPPSQEGIILPARRPTSDTAGRVFVIFVDDLHLGFRNTGRLRSVFKKIANTLIHEGDMFGVVSSGPSRLAIDLTYDKRRLDEAVKKVTGNGLRPSDILDMPHGPSGPPEISYRVRVAFATAIEIIRKLEALNDRRKSFIYLSNGYDFNPFFQARMGSNSGVSSGRGPFASSLLEDYEWSQENDEMFQGIQFADADLARVMVDLTRAANRANTTFYTIDPRGLAGGPEIDEQIEPSQWLDYLRKSQDSLRVIAEGTGGIAVVNQNDFDAALKRIDAETSDYYMLGYYTTNPDPTKKNRKLEIKTHREGADVWSRRAYSIVPIEAPKIPTRP